MRNLYIGLSVIHTAFNVYGIGRIIAIDIIAYSITLYKVSWIDRSLWHDSRFLKPARIKLK